MKKKVSVVCVLSIFLIVVVSVSAERVPFPESTKRELLSERSGKVSLDLTPLAEAISIARKYHIDKDKLDGEKMVKGMIKGLMESLDRYSFYLDSKEFMLMQENFSGNFCGIGAVLEKKRKYLVVVDVIASSPAQTVGLKKKDKIVSINGKEVKKLSLDQAVQLIRGEEGTILNIVISRKGTEEPISLSIKRAVLKIVSVEDIFFEKKEKKFGVLKINCFNADTAIQFEESAKRLLKKGPDYIIFDVRGNPGGFVYSVHNVCSQVVGKGKIIFSTEEYDGNRVTNYSCYESEEGVFSKTKKKVKGFACLIDENSASAAEIFSSCMQEVFKIKLIGETTVGKGTGWAPQPLPSGKGVCNITCMRWFTASGKSIDEVGVEPDIEVERDEEDVFLKKDPQMEAAIEELLK